jgi:hypothetical protein
MTLKIYRFYVIPQVSSKLFDTFKETLYVIRALEILQKLCKCY